MSSVDLLLTNEQFMTDFEGVNINDIEQNSEIFTIKDDNMAEWALKKIKAETNEANRIINACRNQQDFYIRREEQIKNQLNNNISFLKRKLADYFELVPHKKTKTQEKYILPSGELVLKRQNPKFNINQDEAILSVVQVTGTNEYVRQKLELDWENLKKDVEVLDEFIVDKNGNHIEDAFISEDRLIYKISNPTEIIYDAYVKSDVIVHKELKKVINGIITMPQPDKFEVKV